LGVTDPRGFGAQPPASTQAGSSFTVTVRVQDKNGNVVTTGAGSTASVTVAIGTNPSSGTLSGTLTQTAVSGVATFNNLSINKAGNGYTLTASSTVSGVSLISATSNSFNITTGAASKLVFGQQPTNAQAGASITPAPTVQVQDASGNLITTSEASITIAIGVNPGGTLNGTTTVSASGGIATF